MSSSSPTNAATLDSSSQIQDWAASTTQAWTNEVKAEWRRTKRCETLARFRGRKKNMSANMRHERVQLELQVKQRLAALHAAVAQCNASKASNSTCTTEIVCRLALESDALRNKNLEMHQRLLQLKRLWSLIEEGLVVATGFDGVYSSNLNVYEASEKSQWVTSSRPSATGWRVLFPNAEPSFFFHPFERRQFDVIYKKCMDELFFNRQHIDCVGTLFEWTVHYAPLIRLLEDNTVIAHANFFLRAQGSVEDVDGLILRSDLNGLPLVVTPLWWSSEKRDAVSIQVLQEFETDAYIMVCNLSGATHFRYLFLVRREPQLLQSGKRAITYTITIANSEGNDRSRAVEGPQHDVEWARDGASLLAVTEIDDDSVEISFDFKSACRNELLAQHVYTRWAQFVCRWSQKIGPPKLLLN